MTPRASRCRLRSFSKSFAALNGFTLAVCGDDEEIKIGCEAAVGQGWFEAFGLDAFVGMSSFGTSAPAKDAYAHFGITAEAIVETARALLD